MDDSVSKFDIDKGAKAGRDLVFLERPSRQRGSAAQNARSHLAGIIRGLLTGKIKIPNHRPQQARPKRTLENRAQDFELKRNGWSKTTAAVKQAAQEFQCKDSKVWACLREFKRTLREIEAEADIAGEAELV